MPIQLMPTSLPCTISPRNPGSEAARTPDPAPAAAPAVIDTSLQPALAMLRDLPELDLDRVGKLRDALARGALPFDADRLAQLIQRLHGVNGA